ncbi:hypothetical protein KP509_13G089200 [Ceratopteris richardii]|uniref:Uncharacterized protein n=1 Tax=Ceratopteris richardii TaxID=49495 RepID=A0A8T2THT6_CERRI|nr:hypothetical protein KP509_13G089200 [Ceratopteris richardii]
MLSFLQHMLSICREKQRGQNLFLMSYCLLHSRRINLTAVKKVLLTFLLSPPPFARKNSDDKRSCFPVS